MRITKQQFWRWFYLVTRFIFLVCALVVINLPLWIMRIVRNTHDASKSGFNRPEDHSGLF
jgi:hypothetical protein